MKIAKKHLEKIKELERHEAHPILHKIHKKHKISRKTLFYIKEYGPHTNVTKTIIKESIKILLLASLISSSGGVALEEIKFVFISILPLVILLPVLNDMLGNYGTIISSRFSTMLHEGKIKSNWFANKEIAKLFVQIVVVALITAILSSVMALLVSKFSSYALTLEIINKIIAITLIDVAIIVSLLFFVSIMSGLYFFKKQEDPNNFLIPITTSIADFANMIGLFVLVLIFF